MSRNSLFVLALAAVAPLAHAGECEEQFRKSGSIFSGTDFTSRVTVPDLSVADALAQLRGIVVAEKMDVISEDAGTGTMLAEQRATNMVRAVPSLFNVRAVGTTATIDMTVKTEKGQLAKADAVKTEMCRMLAMVKGGKAGKAAAAQGRKAKNADATTVRDVYMFSRDIAHEAKDNPLVVNARHKGRKYALKGKVDYIQEDGDEINVSFDIPEQYEMALRLPNDPPRVGVACLFRQNQMASVLTFRKGDRTQFTGTFLRYDDFKRMVWLQDCTQTRG